MLVPDPQVPLVACALGRYATGSTSVAALTEALAEKGLRNHLENHLALLRTIRVRDGDMDVTYESRSHRRWVHKPRWWT